MIEQSGWWRKNQWNNGVWMNWMNISVYVLCWWCNPQNNRIVILLTGTPFIEQMHWTHKRCFINFVTLYNCIQFLVFYSKELEIDMTVKWISTTWTTFLSIYRSFVRVFIQHCYSLKIHFTFLPYNK